jgi:predicted XRE-type DNA-binding protein
MSGWKASCKFSRGNTWLRGGEEDMKSATNGPTHVTHGNVLDDIGFSPEHATAIKFKAELYQAILKCAKEYSQKELQIILREPQARVSELLNGKIANKTVNKLLHYAGRLGIEAKAKFSRTHKEMAEEELVSAD